MHHSAILISLLLLLAVILLAIKWQETRELKRAMSNIFHRIEQHPLALFAWQPKAPHRPGLWLIIFDGPNGAPKRTQLEITTHRSREGIEQEIGGKILLSLGPLPYAGAALKALGEKRLPSREEAAQREAEG
ncbi:MAG: hypothetical protein IPK22_11385 [Verrucomicrobiaceae bacterium]|nr:hypothetical protein [Verrucomicrobiaceae bacterium]